ncbi:biliverdin-producing heme oxygenase [Chitinophaga horti]|uniref:Biliverdin-producing heme oxygenase n=1 Tax=Chitinophaga horti TaxID=2920382 RepID=A0ABY6J5Y9_9BACT|nr:biliverdin-producing heme oxygenase [Chitinophaga horti]UYQ95100.1 biliverdin-producing heme oxygenase [Chitinophaga horti]
MLSANIKEATREAHLHLEKIVVKKLKTVRSHADYATLLKHFYAYFSHLETAIEPYITADLLPDYKDRRHAAYIKNDMEALGFDTNELPHTTVPEITNAAQAMGALYVMEGSIMGGSIIVQMLAKGGITEGVSFFSGYGEATGQMWGTFIGVLNSVAPDAAAEAQAIQAANDTFSHFADVFDEATVS